MNLADLMTQERRVIQDEQEMLCILLRHDAATQTRLLARLILTCKDQGYRPSSGSASRPTTAGGPTSRLTSVLRKAYPTPISAPEIIAALRAQFPDVEHGYVYQLLCRECRKPGGRFVKFGTKRGGFKYTVRHIGKSRELGP